MRFANLDFDGFRQLAADDTLSCYEKIGFPDAYRKGHEVAIFDDVLQKLPVLRQSGKVVFDIGPGCSELPHLLLGLCEKQCHELVLVDSAEMLSHLPDRPSVRKVGARYPDCEHLLEEYRGRVDAILCYSVLHYVFAEGNIWDFLDCSLELLNHGGLILLGDIPNVSKRRRFFSSPLGVEFHQSFMQTDEQPEVIWNRIERHSIDDSVLLGLLARARAQGFDAYIVPQDPSLPMANRREDLLIRRP